MTTVVAKRTENGVTFVADTQTTAGRRKVPGSVKVVTNSHVTFGFAGRVRVKDVLEHGVVIPKKTKEDQENLRRWAITKLVPAIRKAFEDEKVLGEDDGVAEAEMEVIVATPGLVFSLGGDFSVCDEGADFWAVGSGSEYALGALAAGADPETAVLVASQFDTGTGPERVITEVQW